MTPQSPTRRVRAIGLGLMIVFGLSVGALLSELALRGYLVVMDAQRMRTIMQAATSYPNIGVYGASHWEFDKEFGFVYPAGRKIPQSNIAGDRIVSCDVIRSIDERGNIGHHPGSWETAEIRILVFGDSFPAFYANGQTFPIKLQAELEQRTGKRVHILNFGRDGTGVLQHWRLAAAMIEQWQPDLAIFTFTTDDLDRARIWRTVTRIDGEPRILTSVTPDPDPPIEVAQDTFVYEPRATYEWCQAALKNDGRDPLVADLVFKQRRMIRENGYDISGPYSLTHSFLLAALRHGNPYASGHRETFTIPRFI
ncbi:MAG: hypothetical protein ACKVSF_14900, partial [Alphaproteobacteria bacterium]